MSGLAMLVVAALCVAPVDVFAQGIGPDGGGIDPGEGIGAAPTGGPVPNADDAAREKADAASDADSGKSSKPQPPPSLPGSHALPLPVAPMDRNASDMNPTEALFDAINRGDTEAAREALSRGADPNAHNVLGLTPIAEAVDLGRNDISFLLLSERANAEEAAASVPARPAPRARQSAQSLRGITVQTAAPSLQAGFLGFGGS